MFLERIDFIISGEGTQVISGKSLDDFHPPGSWAYNSQQGSLASGA
jgi:hypothetical protein